jgi:hypothetical protein
VRAYRRATLSLPGGRAGGGDSGFRCISSPSERILFPAVGEVI